MGADEYAGVPATYTITVSSEGDGEITPPGPVQIPHGSSQAFDFEPGPHYHVTDVIVDGESLEHPTDAYLFETVTANRTLHVVFEEGTLYTISASASGNGTIDPSGDVPVYEGESQTFTITPDNGYVIDDVLVDGNSEGPVPGYEFPSVNADHTIHTEFQLGQTDGDGDGVSNYIEGILGTDFNNPDEYPAPGAYYEYDELGRIKRVIRIN